MEAKKTARREAEEDEENRREMEAKSLLKKNAPREAEEQEEEKNRREIGAKKQQQQTNLQTQEQQVKNKPEATEVQLSQTLSASQSGKGSKPNTRRTSMAAKSTVPLPSLATWKTTSSYLIANRLVEIKRMPSTSNSSVSDLHAGTTERITESLATDY
jgi:hypothetical protein